MRTLLSLFTLAGLSGCPGQAPPDIADYKLFLLWITNGAKP
jgi:hypothetical protein